jgi:hypothetical protein
MQPNNFDSSGVLMVGVMNFVDADDVVASSLPLLPIHPPSHHSQHSNYYSSSFVAESTHSPSQSSQNWASSQFEISRNAVFLVLVR